MVYGHLFADRTEDELASLKRLGERWKVSLGYLVVMISAASSPEMFPLADRLLSNTKKKESGYTSNTPFGAQGTLVCTTELICTRTALKLICFAVWDLKNEAPDLFLHLSESDLVIFKGDLNHRKLTYDCHAPVATPFDVAIGPLASEAGAPPVASLRTIKSDVVVGITEADAARLDKEEPGWKISGKYAVVLLSKGQPGQPVQFS
jgi:hypothetical protein